MEYRKVGEAYLVRMDPGEEILEQLERFARQEQDPSGRRAGTGCGEGVHRGCFQDGREKVLRQPLFRKF